MEHQRAVETARTMASGIVPANAVDQARVETRPTSYGWRVVFRDVQVACSQTGFRCSPTAADVAAGGSDPLFRDVLVCVEYGTARGFFIAGMVRPVATVSWRDPGGAGCMRSKLPSPPSAP